MGNVCMIITGVNIHRDNEIEGKGIDRNPDIEGSSTSISTSTSTSSSASNSTSYRIRNSNGSLSFPRRWITSNSKKNIPYKTPQNGTHSTSTTSPVWQRGILMGEKCELPDFSGLILYDEHGNSTQQRPCKSPKHAAHSALRLVA
ncbi:hypothetical protein KP509_30G047500 [Ceratopteris richardii]|uniref:Uncharacterized protein n=1 Tax=Ceratopteris richardii TaxID=49495 RepID=A0A8T2R3P4_CERRI|nr:hypothetical protein KP509_30G047500 [Ceratopteris richardii]KAH7290414.1 hypothetical protein KP509_30G047500 [Ceratopteris richardii]